MGDNHTHLTLDERIVIEEGLKKKMSFAEIGRAIDKDRSTITREVRRNRKRYMGTLSGGKVKCIHTPKTCPASQACKTTCFTRNCHKCSKLECNDKCPSFEIKECELLKKAPYVCNACRKRGFCQEDKYYYNAKIAHEKYKDVLVSSREGVNLTPEEHARLDAIIKEGISRGLSPYQILQQNGGEEGLGICEKTFYNYINGGVFPGLCRIDMRQRMYKPRKKNVERTYKKDKKCLEGRRYEDFQAYLTTFSADEVPSVVEMDTVLGRANTDDYCLLTLHFTACRFQLAYVRERNTSESVTAVFNFLYQKLGHDDFSLLFPVILTDNGSEFSDPTAVEISKDGRLRTRLFYTHPNSSFEKGSCEKNHEFIRYIVPKGTELKMSQKEARLMMSHINSLPRKSLNGLSPYQMFRNIYGDSILDKLGIVEIPSADLLLKPELIKK